MRQEKFVADIAIIGHIAKDIIEIDGKKTNSVGGAVYYGGIAGAQMGLKIFIITRLKKEDDFILNDFQKFGIKYFKTYSNETSGIRNIYNSDNVEYRTYKPLGFAGLFNKSEIPELNIKYFVIGPILGGEIDLDLLTHIYIRFKNKICLDIQGFIRFTEDNQIIYRNILEKDISQILSKVNILKLDQKEAQILTNNDNVKIEDAGKYLLSFGPQEIMITHSKGISVFTNEDSFFYPWHVNSLMGRTGRGDTAFISYIGSRLTKNMNDSLKFATALTSLKLEKPGPFNLPLSQVEQLIKARYQDL